MMRDWIALCEDQEEVLPPDVVKAFEELGDQQRGEPERAMLRVQFAMGGGVLNPVVEHVGDITHRMSHMVKYGTVLGREKIIKTYDWLATRYGFEREFEENLRNNARYVRCRRRNCDPRSPKLCGPMPKPMPSCRCTTGHNGWRERRRSRSECSNGTTLDRHWRS